MEYNLKNTKTSDAETIDHLLTVIDSLLQEKNEALEDNLTNLSMIKWKEAKTYLECYMFEWFNQNN